MHFIKITLLTVAFSLLLLSLACASSSPTQQPKHCSELENTCSRFQGQPYVWGDEFGRDQKGGDCSGYVFRVAKLMGEPLPRTTSKRYWFLVGGDKQHWRNASCGYLVWWTFEPDRPYGHVGIMVKPPKFWQSGSSHGVYSRKFFKGSYWDEHFSGAKDYF